jgi:hypothetical protein
MFDRGAIHVDMTRGYDNNLHLKDSELFESIFL